MFRFLDTTQVVFTNIINQLTPSELITLSLCAKRARNLAQMYRKKTAKWEIVLFTYRLNGISVRLDGKLHNIIAVFPESRRNPETVQKNIEIYGSKVFCGIDFDGITSFWDNIQTGIIRCLNYILNFLGRIYVDIADCHPESFWVFYMLKQLNMTVARAHINANRALYPMEYDHLLRNCVPTDGLYILNPHPTMGYRYEGPFPKLSTLWIENGDFITVDSLMAMEKIKKIRIEGIDLTDMDINRYLKNWLAGKSDLKILRLEMPEIENPEQVLDGLEGKLEFVEKKREFLWTHNDVFYLRECYDLARDDGVVASFQWISLENGRSLFSMYVWPDMEGRSHVPTVDTVHRPFLDQFHN